MLIALGCSKINLRLLQDTSILQFSVLTCGQPESLENGAIVPSNGPYTCGQDIEYRCNSGYAMDLGESLGSDKATCLSSGQWSAVPCTCRPSMYACLVKMVKSHLFQIYLVHFWCKLSFTY